MKNFLDYFYNIKIDKIEKNKNYYTFYYNSHNYELYIYDENLDINKIYNINKNLLIHTKISEIILNKQNNIISTYDNKKYILIKININEERTINLNDINYLNNILKINEINKNWGKLWEKKIDYIENLLCENKKKYPLIVESIDYFIGLAENAISYFYNINLNENLYLTINHRYFKLDLNIKDFYNPLNITLDYRVRDIAEYIKYSYFNNIDIDTELDRYIYLNNLSPTEVKLLISRVLYPSFYFNLLDDIIIYNENENILIPIITKLDDYEIYISKFINKLSKLYNVEQITWLKKDYN